MLFRNTKRLAVSYAIAQSTVLAVFEARIEKKMEEYKYIPETLASVGSLHLSQVILDNITKYFSSISLFYSIINCIII